MNDHYSDATSSGQSRDKFPANFEKPALSYTSAAFAYLQLAALRYQISTQRSLGAL